jgi:plastocyanin
MTDTTTDDVVSDDVTTEVEPAADATPDVAVAAAKAAKARNREALETRLLIPLLLPVLAMIAVALWTLNVSRVFLAGDSTSALVIATIITVGILCAGALISATPKARTSSLAMVTTLVLVIVVSAGLLALGPSLDTGKKAGSTQLAQPKCTPVSTVDVVALQSVKFNSVTFTATGGCVQMNYTGAIGHTLQFRTLNYKGFPLGTDAGAPKSGTVDLKPGTYKIYCTVDSHAAQGMEATITVTAAPPPSS